MALFCMRAPVARGVLALTLAAAYWTGGAPAEAQGLNLAKCEGLWFSTSEDFLSRGPQLPGGPVVSDGDLLSFRIGGGAQICARNAELMAPFDIARFDHGLDALDQIPINQDTVFVAFSTEIDSVNGAQQFTAGDLLFGDGTVVPNAALLARFDLPRSLNLGLDAVHIEGSPREKRTLINRLRDVPVNRFRENPGILIEILEATNTDILFSTEGTPPEVEEPRFLDGDLLSARTGTIVRANRDLLPALPAGLPDRGVDYGLDAYTPAVDPIELVPIELLSIEIQARDGTFSDGDALLPGPSVYLRNRDLIASFEPLDTDMGLDALAAGMTVTGCLPYITAVSDIYVADIDPVTGLFDTDRPFGRDVRVQGVVPGAACPEYNTHEFQVRVSVDGGPEVAILHPAGQGWMRDVLPTCNGNDLYTNDPAGWFTLTDYWRFGECPDDASLAVWRSTTAPGADFAQFRIAMQPIGGGPETLSAPVRIRIDNDKPNPVTLALFQPGSPPVAFDDQCKIDGEGNDVIIDILGEIADEHFSHYTLTWTGNGNIGGTVPVTVARTYDAGRPDLNDTGTQPPGADVPLGTLNLTQEFFNVTGGQPLIECGYQIELTAWDRAHNGAMNFGLNAFSHTTSNWDDYEQTFCLVP